jgi:hypothetical protein
MFAAFLQARYQQIVLQTLESSANLSPVGGAHPSFAAHKRKRRGNEMKKQTRVIHISAWLQGSWVKILPEAHAARAASASAMASFSISLHRAREESANRAVFFA